MSTQTAPDFPMLELVLDWLELDPQQGYRLHPEGERAIALGLDVLLASGAPAKAALQDVVRLATVLRREHGATEVADQLLGVLLDSEAALAALGVPGRAPRQDLRKFLGESAAQAPHVGAKAPLGSVPVSAFMSPPRPLRRG